MDNKVLNKHICLVVLPLQVLSDHPKVVLFCQGLVMDLITDLSRFRSFQIIAYETTKGFHPNELPESPKLENLNIDYLVKGMVRHQDEKLLFNLQLVNFRQNRLVWAEKFSGGFDKLLQIQEEIVEKIVVSLRHFVDYDLLSELRKKPLTNLNTYECWLKGFQEIKRGNPEADEQARVYFQQAIEMDPHYSRAYSGMSLAFFNEWSCQVWSRWEVSQKGAFEWAQKALELDDWDHVSNVILGRVYVFNGEYEKGERYLRKSLQINANDAEMLAHIAYNFIHLGYLEEAKQLYERSRRLNPVQAYADIGTYIHFEMGEFDEALAIAEQQEINKTQVDFPAYHAAAFFHKGNLEKMQEHWQVFLREFSQKINGGKPTDTQTAVQWMMNVHAYRGETQLQPFWEHLSQSDLEELVLEKPGALAAQQNRFSQEAGLWSVSFGGRQAQLPDLKGYHDLTRLLAQPRQPIHCTELMGAQTLQSGQAVFDEKAKAAYQKRILELHQEMEEAETAHESERLGALREEYDRLIEHLCRETGKGGKARKVTGTIGKCRSAVTWRIRSAIKKIGETHPALGKHLEASIKTGVFCEYAPEYEIDWVL